MLINNIEKIHWVSQSLSYPIQFVTIQLITK